MAVADHQTMPLIVSLAGQLSYICVDFSFQRGGQHPPGALPNDLVDQGSISRRAIIVDYREHGRAFPTDAPTSAYSIQVDRLLGKVRPPEPIHRI
jgi:hypothetical protein